MKTTSDQQHYRELHGPDKSKVNNNIGKDATPMLWDSLESDTESLVQEKEYQRELQMRITHDSDLLSAEVSKQPCGKPDRERSEYGGEYPDGLQELKPRQAKRPQITARHGTRRQTVTEDDYADLRYDPNWRQNLEGVQFLNLLKARLSLDSFEGSEDSLESLEDVAVGRRQEYTVVNNQPSLQMDSALFSQPPSPFHLHPQQEDAPDPSESKCSSMFSEHTVLGVREHLNVKRKSVASQKRSSQCPSDVTPVNAREDIVERNKATLGVNTHKQGSYLRAHQQRDKHVVTKQTRRTSGETVGTCSPESQDNVRDPELMWLQKTLKLKQSHKERKDPKKKDRTNTSDQLKAPEVKPKPGMHLKPLSERRIISADHLPQRVSEDHLLPDAPLVNSYSYDPPQHLPSHSNAPPAVNLNINIHSPASHSQPLNLTQQDKIFTLVSQALQWERPDLFNPPLFQPGYQFDPSVHQNEVRQMGLISQGVSHRKYTVDRDVTQVLVQRNAGKLLPNAFENVSFKNNSRIRIPVLQLPTSPQSENSHYPSGFTPTDEGPCAPQTQISSVYTLLPPIAKANVSDTEVLSDRSEQQLNPIHRSSSEGYLSQMERHRQLKAKSNYKAYTLNDFKNLKQEVNLGGLGPTNTIPEAVAEKIRRQKLYSNVIRQQNKKISRIPSLPAKDPVGSDNKDPIPRIKALEYAKTIAKPKAPPKTNDRPGKKNESMQAPYLQEMDLLQQATLEMLRRHEEEKQAVARFKTIHAI